jgi:hypothetical protein
MAHGAPAAQPDHGTLGTLGHHRPASDSLRLRPNCADTSEASGRQSLGLTKEVDCEGMLRSMFCPKSFLGTTAGQQMIGLLCSTTWSRLDYIE